ncbi:C-C motif chemokine 26, partial [Galemys pyrenaicus]
GLLNLIKGGLVQTRGTCEKAVKGLQHHEELPCAPPCPPGSHPECPSRSLHPDIAKFCCFQFSHRIIPWKWVQTHEFTRNSCSRQAVIFTTKRGQKVCAQSEEKWVQKYISLLKARQHQLEQ